MSLLRQLQDGATSDAPLSSLLRMALVLGSRLNHEPLRNWAEWELDGYPNIDALPDYRRGGPARVIGNFSGPFGSGLQNAEIPPACIDEADREALFELYYATGVGPYERLLASGENVFYEYWPGDALIKYADRVYEMQTLMSAKKVIPAGGIAGVLDAVRTKLLALSLEIEKEAPDVGELGASEEPPISPDRVGQIFNVTVHGDHANVVAAARDAHGEFIREIGWDSLRAELSQAGVPEADLEELRAALTRDQAAGHVNTVGPETERWIGRLTANLGRGAVELGGNTTAGVVAGLILKAVGAN